MEMILMWRIIEMRNEIRRFVFTFLYFVVSLIVGVIQVNYEIYKKVFKK